MRRRRLAEGLFAVMLVVAAATAPLVDRDEPRYAQAVREMRQTGDLLIPRNFGRLRPDKPILIYWLQFLTVSVFGEREFAFRLPSLVALGLWLWAISGLSREITGKGCWVMMPGLALAGIHATPDACVGALTTGSLWAFIGAVKRSSRSLALLGWILFALGVLTKGPVTPLFLFPALGGFCARVPRAWEKVFPWWGPVVALILVGGWLVPAGMATHWEFFRQSFARHILQRSLTPLEGHGLAGPVGLLVGPLFYLFSLALATGPLILSFPSGLREVRHTQPQAFRAVIWGIGVPLSVLSLVATKLPHYILPAAPLVAVVARPTLLHQRVTAWFCALLIVVWSWVAWQAPYRPIGKALATSAAPTIAFPPQEPSLLFYAGEKLKIATAQASGFRQALLRPGEEKLLLLAPGQRLRAMAIFRGWNLAKGRREQLNLYHVE